MSSATGPPHDHTLDLGAEDCADIERNVSTIKASRELLHAGSFGDDRATSGSHSVYVLSPDGSSLFLLDATHRPLFEQPPPYPTLLRSEGSARSSATDSFDLPPNSLGLVSHMSGHSTEPISAESGHVPTVRVSSDAGVRRQRAATTTATGRRHRASSDASERVSAPMLHSAHTSPARPANRLERMASDTGPRRHTRSDASESYRLLADERTPLLGVPPSASARRSPGTRSLRSISISSNAPHNIRDIVNTIGTSLPSSPARPRPSNWRNMLRANSTLEHPVRVQTVNTSSGEAIVVTRTRKKKHWAIRYASPLWSKAHWRALFHLVFINFPFVSLAVVWAPRRYTALITSFCAGSTSLAAPCRRHFGRHGSADLAAYRSARVACHPFAVSLGVQARGQTAAQRSCLLTLIQHAHRSRCKSGSTLLFPRKSRHPSTIRYFSGSKRSTRRTDLSAQRSAPWRPGALRLPVQMQSGGQRWSYGKRMSSRMRGPCSAVRTSRRKPLRGTAVLTEGTLRSPFLPGSFLPHPDQGAHHFTVLHRHHRDGSRVGCTHRTASWSTRACSALWAVAGWGSHRGFSMKFRRHRHATSNLHLVRDISSSMALGRIVHVNGTPYNLNLSCQCKYRCDPTHHSLNVCASSWVSMTLRKRDGP